MYAQRQSPLPQTPRWRFSRKPWQRDHTDDQTTYFTLLLTGQSETRSCGRSLQSELKRELSVFRHVQDRGVYTTMTSRFLRNKNDKLCFLFSFWENGERLVRERLFIAALTSMRTGTKPGSGRATIPGNCLTKKKVTVGEALWHKRNQTVGDL